MRAVIGLEIPENIRTLYTSSCKTLHNSANMLKSVIAQIEI